ncbi:MAG TPA: nitrate reductase subunit alpha, partial [Sphingomicrobium sp.]|nr:nitrate reductase subunit alpha [Sphingomicrobium sp.]
MSHFLDRLTFFRKNAGTFSNGHGVVTREDRGWEDGYRDRWSHDKVVRSTHGVNCTGSCSWKIYVKDGIVTWETQQTDYPRTRPGLPNHEPRGCARGASYSWYLYSANRVKHPLIRKRLLKLWRTVRGEVADPVEAWKTIVETPEHASSYKKVRGLGGFVRLTWDEANEIIAAANVYTAKAYGPDRVAGFSPIPAMSMVSYAAGARYLSLIGGVCLSFYDWYCDLPASSPQTWGEQTDVPESADWYNSTFLMLWGSNVPQTRTPDAHFYSEVRYKGAKSVVICPDYSEAAKFADLWMAPKQGTDSALAMAMGHVILKEFHVDRQAEYFRDYCRKYSDMPMLVRLAKRGDAYVPERFVRASDFDGSLDEAANPEWKTVAVDEASGELVTPLGSIGFRWGDKGKWNLEERTGSGRDVRLAMSLADRTDAVAQVDFPYFGSGPQSPYFTSTAHGETLRRNVPVRKLKLRDGDAFVATVHDLIVAHYGVDRGLGGLAAKSFDDDTPYTPAWAEKITGVPRDQIIATARDFASNAEKTNGKSMVILGAGINHWYHMDMIYRGIINLLVFCGCVGQSGGGWSHYVGQEKLRPQTGWLPLAFGLDWTRPPRQMNGTSFFYAHTDQWRYESLKMSEILSPLAPEGDWSGSLLDYNAKAERMGWLPSAPQFDANPIEWGNRIKSIGADPATVVVDALKAGDLKPASLDPDNPVNWPRNMFFWRSNVLGASGKGHEYFLKHLVGSMHGVIGTDEEAAGLERPKDVVWRDDAPVGKLDLMVNIDFRMSTTSIYSDVVLPTATWYEKHDLNTSDMHPFIHPLSAAVDPAWETKSDWNIFREIAKKFSDVAPEVLGVEHDLVMTPILHDTPAELAQPYEPKDWLKGECEPIPGKTMPNVTIVERNYPETFARFTSMGPLLEKLGNGAKGLNWDTKHEVELLGDLNGRVIEGTTEGRPKIDSDIDACETILMLAPETNGEVAVKAWESLGKITGRDHSHLAEGKEEEKIRFRDVAAQPRKIISSPIWSGLESEHVCYNAGYTNVHELIPWRTLTGRQQLYQDHHWMRAFGEAFVTWRPPIDTKTVRQVLGKLPNGNQEILLNILTPHQKWGIHSTYTENLIMLSL